ncbi:hypothetical protein ACFQ61_11230 [Streptomyces sp. NPDC056500]|uniref:hypothetical protein n=1 Tax=Streptomyces sp. NPDC056500 TaxID=3345840 RepID=UPI0036AA99FA
MFDVLAVPVASFVYFALFVFFALLERGPPGFALGEDTARPAGVLDLPGAASSVVEVLSEAVCDVGDESMGTVSVRFGLTAIN